MKMQLMAMKSGCKIYNLQNLIVILHMTVKDVATLFCSSSVKPPTSSTRPC